MKISNINTYKTTNFNSRKIYSAKIKKQNTSTDKETSTDIFITKLEKGDLKRLERESDLWKKTSFGEDIIYWLRLHDSKENRLSEMPEYFYAIEIPQANGKKQIRALALVTNYFNSGETYLNLLQTNNSLAYNNIIHGAGSCLLYAAIEQAKKAKAKTFSLASSKDSCSFYKKAGLISDGYGNFFLEKKSFSPITQRLRQKYHIKKVQK